MSNPNAVAPNRRPDPTKCGSGLHDWIEENIYTDPKGTQTCRPCKRIRETDKRYNRWTPVCDQGHELTPDNTRDYKGVPRFCRTCAAERRERFVQALRELEQEQSQEVAA
jgi:hypothetical protein